MGPCESCHKILPAGGNPGQAPAGSNQFAVGPGGAVGMNAAITTVALRQPADALQMWIGAEVQPIDRVIASHFKVPFTYGVFVNSVYPGSPSGKADLRSGDIIFKMDGRWVYSSKDIVDRLAGYSEGDEVRLSIFRNGKKQDVYLTVGMKPSNVTPALQPMPGRGGNANQPVMNQAALQQPRPAMPPNARMNPQSVVPKEFEWLGLEADPINGAIVRDHPSLKGKKGALVIEVTPGSKAAMAGLKPRDIIVSVNRMPVDSARALNDAINLSDVRKGILLEIERGNNRMYTVVQ